MAYLCDPDFFSPTFAFAVSFWGGAIIFSEGYIFRAGGAPLYRGEK